MRVIAGIYRGRILKSPFDLKMRPTSDRLRETLFNVVAARINDETRFLDLCAGTGAIGIEALSRGAAHATFVDKSRKACALIETNLDALAIAETQTEVVQNEADDFLRRRKKLFAENERANSRWNIVYFDPPYLENYQTVLELFGWEDTPLLEPGAIVVAEHHHKNELPDLVHRLRRWRILKQGDSALSFYEFE